jgi:glycosyltransferase involved in cell wall biosynthesis
MSHPLVSLVCPTYNRSNYLSTAIRCFNQQTYHHLELIIVDDSEDLSTTCIPAEGRIRHIRLNKRTATGTKRNIGADAANGDIIANLDDDDWSSPFRIEDQVQRLLKSGKAVTGYNVSIVYDEASRLFYSMPGGPPYFASGSSQCYWKSWWQWHQYPDVSFGEDSVFSRTARLADQLAIADPGRMMVIRRHANNTSPVQISKYPRVCPTDICPEFFRAIENPQQTLDYMWAAHTASLQDAQMQFQKPTVEYKVDRLPEVDVR